MRDSFETYDFEELLKRAANNFTLQPSRKVWSSIYNSMHPSKRWPSVSIGIMFGAILLYIGHLNNKNISQTTINTNKSIVIEQLKSKATTHSFAMLMVNSQIQNTLAPGNTFNQNNKYLNGNNISVAKNISQQEEIPVIVARNIDDYSTQLHTSVFHNNIAIKQEPNFSKEELMERSSKLGWQVYASPSIGYENDNTQKMSSNFSKNTVTNNNIIQQPLLGMELGASMQYAILNRLKITTGLQLNYTAYNNKILSSSDITDNGYYKLQNELYQLSVPVGLEVKVLGNTNIQWHVGATVQPSYVMAGKLHGSGNVDDKTYSAYNNTLTNALNNWNVNAGLETFVSYKTKSVTWQLGPQMRYQFLPTYSNLPLYNQHFMNYGVKLGISKSLH